MREESMKGMGVYGTSTRQKHDNVGALKLRGGPPQMVILEKRPGKIG
jgi:hypothetical protein